MTFEEFTLTLSQQFNTQGNEEQGLVINYEGLYILDIAIRISKVPLNQLQQATTLIFRAPAAGSVLMIPLGDPYTFPVKVERVLIGQYYVYHFTEGNKPTMETSPTLPIEADLTDLVILPDVQNGNFLNNEYDILFNNVNSSRRSTYIQLSDRNSPFTLPNTDVTYISLPGNFLNILAGNAEYAQVQDSNYSDSGWISSRYRGTPTNRLNYIGPDPAIAGNIFEGSAYQYQIQDNIIISQPDAERTYQNYIVTGIDTLPTYLGSEQNTNFELSSNIGETTTLFEINPGIFRTINIEVGDVIFPGTSKERFKVLSIQPLITGRSQVTVQRGWNNTKPEAHTQYTSLKKIKPTFVYQVNKNRTASTGRVKIRVTNTQEILYIDSEGMIISGSNIS